MLETYINNDGALAAHTIRQTPSTGLNVYISCLFAPERLISYLLPLSL